MTVDETSLAALRLSAGALSRDELIKFIMNLMEEKQSLEGKLSAAAAVNESLQAQIRELGRQGCRALEHQDSATGTQFSDPTPSRAVVPGTCASASSYSELSQQAHQGSGIHTPVLSLSLALQLAGASTSQPINQHEGGSDSPAAEPVFTLASEAASPGAASAHRYGQLIETPSTAVPAIVASNTAYPASSLFSAEQVGNLTCADCTALSACCICVSRTLFCVATCSACKHSRQ